MIKQKSSIVRKGYDKIAEKYHKQRSKHSSKSLLTKFSKLLPKGSTVLDLGCGAGVPVTKFFVQKGYEVTGIDFSKSMLKLARKNVPEARFIKMDITKMKFKPNAFDGAVSFYAIIHIQREKHAGIYKKLHDTLKPDAIILFNPGTDNWEGYEEDFLGARMFWSQYDPKKTLKIIKNAGFEIIWSKILKLPEKQFWILARNKK